MFPTVCFCVCSLCCFCVLPTQNHSNERMRERPHRKLQGLIRLICWSWRGGGWWWSWSWNWLSWLGWRWLSWSWRLVGHGNSVRVSCGHLHNQALGVKDDGLSAFHRQFLSCVVVLPEPCKVYSGRCEFGWCVGKGKQEGQGYEVRQRAKGRTRTR